MHSQSDAHLGESYASAAFTAPAVPVEESEDVLTVLSDEAARSILCVADEPMTAKELAQVCGIPLSTVYRKLETLVQLSLLDESTRPRVYGKHPQQYQRRFETVQVQVPSSRTAGMNISLVPRATEED